MFALKASVLSLPLAPMPTVRHFACFQHWYNCAFTCFSQSHQVHLWHFSITKAAWHTGGYGKWRNNHKVIFADGQWRSWWWMAITVLVFSVWEKSKFQLNYKRKPGVKWHLNSLPNTLKWIIEGLNVMLKIILWHSRHFSISNHK